MNNEQALYPKSRRASAVAPLTLPLIDCPYIFATNCMGSRASAIPLAARAEK